MDTKVDSNAYYEQGRRSHCSKHYDKSTLLCKRALTTKSNHHLAHFLWGRNLIEQRVSDTAIRKHKEIISRNPSDQDAYYNFGWILEYQNKLPEAEIQYKKCLKLNSSHDDAHHNLTNNLTKQGRYKEALAQSDENLIENRNKSSKNNAHGYLNLILKRYEEAIKCFESALWKDPEYVLSIINKSIALHCLGKEELAVESLKRSLWEPGHDEDWQKRFQDKVFVYERELEKFEKILESKNLGEINRDHLVKNIKALSFIIDLLNKEFKGEQ